jgi:hypothetical protein
MVVVDENLHSRSLMAEIAGWYRGQVVSITVLRPGSLIKDDAIPGLLLKASQPTFVTINTEDFWPIILPHPGYCVVTFALPKERALEIPLLLRRLFRLPHFRSKAARMGKIIRVSDTRLAYYERDRRIQRIAWPET